MPAAKLFRVGVWEDGAFVGCVLFGSGANREIGTPFGVTQQQACELVRIAMRQHTTPVTRCVKYALKLLKQHNPKLEVVVSYADVDRDHVGKIYQAGNWTYLGCVNKGGLQGYVIHGNKHHNRSCCGAGITTATIAKQVDPNSEPYYTKGKLKYAMALSRDMQRVLDGLRVSPAPKTLADII